MIKKLIPVVTCLVIIFVLATSFTSKKHDYQPDAVVALAVNNLYYTVLNKDESIAVVVPKEEFSLFLGKTFIGFKEALAFKESQGRYRVVNTFGYLGKYQFGKGTLKLVGVYDSRMFIENSEIQEKAFEANLSRNKWILKRDIKRFVGKTISGVRITESGILAAAHLGGPGSVKKFLRSYGKTTFKDGYGSSVRHYMKKFSGYDTSSVSENRKAKV